jgi:hypothetical protein
MKKADKTSELIENGKQLQFEGIPEGNYRKRRRDVFGRKSTTYWRCKNNHIFPIKFKILKERRDRLRCPMCSASIENQSNKSAYLYYLHKQGRGHERNYRKSIKKLATDKND